MVLTPSQCTEGVFRADMYCCITRTILTKDMTSGMREQIFSYFGEINNIMQCITLSTLLETVIGFYQYK